MEQIIKVIQEEDNELVGETEEVFGLGKCDEGVQRPAKINEVHDTYHGLVEMCFKFYEAKHFC